MKMGIENVSIRFLVVWDNKIVYKLQKIIISTYITHIYHKLAAERNEEMGSSGVALF